jgi:hypothetical protein
MTAKRRTIASDIYQIKVTLRHSKPPIWRRIQVPEDVTLARLHHILQVVLGWEDYHLHQFIIDDEYYGEPHPDYEVWGPEMRDERHVRLGQLVPEADLKFVYEYDFGDGWEHELLVEKILPPQPGVSYPRCIKGKRACPPEDVGGVWGYADFLEVIRDPDHPEHEEWLEWVGGEFDPEVFDLEEVNAGLEEMW